MGDAWKCPKCGTVLQKPDYWKAMPFSTMVGTVRCGGCGAAYGAREIQSGRYDVGAATGLGSWGGSTSERNEPLTSRFPAFLHRFAAHVIDSVIIRRLAAHIIDSVILGVVVSPFIPLVDSIAPTAVLPSVLVPLWLYYAFTESGSMQATPGKMTMGLKVTDPQNNRITFVKATARFAAKILSAWILGIGFLMILFTEKKQGLHDKIVKTLVVNR